MASKNPASKPMKPAETGDTPIYDALLASRLAFGGKTLAEHVDLMAKKKVMSKDEAAKAVLNKAGQVQRVRTSRTPKPVAAPVKKAATNPPAAGGKPGPAAAPKRGPAQAPKAKIKKVSMVRENSLPTRKLNSKGKTGK